MGTVSEFVFRRATHSEQDRKDFIAKEARKIEQQIFSCLHKNDSEALEVAGDLIGHMDDETMAKILRSALIGDLSGANNTRLLITAAVGESVRRIAELRAVRFVDEMEPETH